MLLSLLFACSADSPAEALPDTGVESDTGETGQAEDTAVDTDEDTGVETGEDTAADTADTGEDTAADTGEDTAVDTGDTGEDTAADTAVTPADYTATSGATMIYVAARSASIGGGLGDPDGLWVDHDVTLTHGFYLAETETTRGQWEADPANVDWVYSSIDYGYVCTGTIADCPADTMTWAEAAMYANGLSVKEGLPECYLADGTEVAAAYLADPYGCLGYRLPTEAEWEVAARADVDTAYAGSNTSTDVAWTSENTYAAGTYVHEVCTLAVNAWGFCDLSGNVWEWTNDRYDVAYGGYGSGAADTDPTGGLTGTTRVIRGGYWLNYALYARVAYRGDFDPSTPSYALGFRLARTAP